MALGKVQISAKDYAKQKSGVAFYIESNDADTVADLNVKATALREAVEGVAAGETQVVTVTSAIDERSSDPAAAPSSRREVKWLIQATNNATNKPVTREVPIADTVTPALVIANTEKADLTATAWVNFETAFNTHAKDEDGNALTFVDARLVGRNI